MSQVSVSVSVNLSVSQLQMRQELCTQRQLQCKDIKAELKLPNSTAESKITSRFLACVQTFEDRGPGKLARILCLTLLGVEKCCACHGNSNKGILYHSESAENLFNEKQKY